MIRRKAIKTNKKTKKDKECLNNKPKDNNKNSKLKKEVTFHLFSSCPGKLWDSRRI